MIHLRINQGMTDRRSRGPQRPGDSQGRHALLLNEPEQLRGPLSPYHARLGHQGGYKEDVMTSAQMFVGIDVSKAQLDVALRPEGQFSAPNDEAGWAQVLERLSMVHPRLVVLEAHRRVGDPGVA